MAEASRILYSNYPPIRSKFKNYSRACSVEAQTSVGDEVTEAEGSCDSSKVTTGRLHWEQRHRGLVCQSARGYLALVPGRGPVVRRTSCPQGKGEEPGSEDRGGPTALPSMWKSAWGSDTPPWSLPSIACLFLHIPETEEALWASGGCSIPSLILTLTHIWGGVLGVFTCHSPSPLFLGPRRTPYSGAWAQVGF